MLWVQDAPKVDKDPDDVVCVFIDKYITAVILPVIQTVQNTLVTAGLHNISTQHFLQDINLDVETYMDALKISKRGPNVILQQNPKYVFINAFSHDILSLWGGNINHLQYGINEITTVKYVCSYMTKGEKGMDETLKRVAKE